MLIWPAYGSQVTLSFIPTQHESCCMLMVISHPGMVRGRLPSCWSKLGQTCTRPTKKVASHPKYCFSSETPAQMTINNTSKITQTSPNDHQQQLPPGKTPELLADFVNEQPMKVFKAIFTNSFINQILLETLFYNALCAMPCQ